MMPKKINAIGEMRRALSHAQSEWAWACKKFGVSGLKLVNIEFSINETLVFVEEFRDGKRTDGEFRFSESAYEKFINAKTPKEFLELLADELDFRKSGSEKNDRYQNCQNYNRVPLVGLGSLS